MNTLGGDASLGQDGRSCCRPVQVRRLSRSCEFNLPALAPDRPHNRDSRSNDGEQETSEIADQPVSRDGIAR